MTGYLLNTDGSVEPCSGKLHEEGDRNLSALYEALGCSMVERVVVEGGELWADEEGLFKQPLVLNPTATAICRGGQIVGRVYLRVRKGFTLNRAGEIVRARTDGSPTKGLPV